MTGSFYAGSNVMVFEHNSVLPSIFYLRSKSITRSPRDYSHKRFIRESLLYFARTRMGTCDMISTILASDQAEWQSTLMKTFCIDTQQQKKRARARRSVDIVPSRHHFHAVEQKFRITIFMNIEHSALWPDVSAIPFCPKKECLTIIIVVVVVVPQLLYPITKNISAYLFLSRESLD